MSGAIMVCCSPSLASEQLVGMIVLAGSLTKTEVTPTTDRRGSLYYLAFGFCGKGQDKNTSLSLSLAKLGCRHRRRCVRWAELPV